AGAGALHDKLAQAMREAHRELQSQHAAKGNSHDSWAFERVPFEKLGKVADEIVQPKAAAQGKTIVFATQLVSDDTVFARQDASEWAEEFKTACQPRDQYQRRALAPLAILGRVMGQMRTAIAPRARRKRSPRSNQPLSCCLHSTSPNRALHEP